MATRPRNVTRLEYETLVRAPLEAAFAFFSDASNLEWLTPPWVRFSIVTPPPIVMRAGLEIDYRIRLHGVPLAWTSRIDVWEPGRRFVDRQIAGPYWWWRHEHRFEAAGGATRVIDEVEYLPRVAWMTAGVVRRDVERIFRYRQDALQRIFDHGSGPRISDSTSGSKAGDSHPPREHGGHGGHGAYLVSSCARGTR
jgi:ligand-binding SRPBCC domain-containing protein